MNQSWLLKPRRRDQLLPRPQKEWSCPCDPPEADALQRKTWAEKEPVLIRETWQPVRGFRKKKKPHRCGAGLLANNPNEEVMGAAHYV